MKKLMIAAAIVCAAAFAQAATVNWGGAISEPDGETPLAPNTMAYLVFSSSAISPAAGATFDGTSLKNGETEIAAMVDSYAITASDAEDWSFLKAYDNPGASVDGFYAVLISDNGTNPTYSVYAYDEITGTTAASQPTNRVVDWGEGYLTQGGYTVASAVPEPTSGLLLLLGVAGLALRRRRA